MIVTKHFVMINFPKTGSSFARKVVKQAYENRERRLDRRILRKARLRPWPIRERRCFNPIRGYEDQHGRVEQIAENDRRKTVVSIARDPVERILSVYNHSFRTPLDDYLPSINIIMRTLSIDYPNVTFYEFYEMWKPWNAYWLSARDLPIGPQTMEFVNFFSTDPDAFYKHLRLHEDDIEGLGRYLPKHLKLLRNESLNRDVKTLLLGIGFHESEVAFIDKHPNVYPDGIGRTYDDISPTVLDAGFLNKFMEEERILYKLYSHYGISYSANPGKAASPGASKPATAIK